VGCRLDGGKIIARKYPPRKRTRIASAKKKLSGRLGPPPLVCPRHEREGSAAKERASELARRHSLARSRRANAYSSGKLDSLRNKFSLSVAKGARAAFRPLSLSPISVSRVYVRLRESPFPFSFRFVFFLARFISLSRQSRPSHKPYSLHGKARPRIPTEETRHPGLLWGLGGIFPEPRSLSSLPFSRYSGTDARFPCARAFGRERLPKKTASKEKGNGGRAAFGSGSREISREFGTRLVGRIFET
jgi:hypothetical protein